MGDNSATKVITGIVRLSYPAIWEPKSASNGKNKDKEKDKKYSASLIIPKSEKKTIIAIKNAVAAAKEEGKGSKWNGKIPKPLKEPLRDGDEERDDAAYENCYFVNASSSNKPGIVKKKGGKTVHITDEDEVYAGCWVIASINFYPFNVDGNKGVACGLNNILFVKDGLPLSGGASAEDDFEEVEVPEEDYEDFDFGDDDEIPF